MSIRIRVAIVSVSLLLGHFAWPPGTVAEALSISGVFVDGWPGLAQPYAPINLTPATSLETIATDEDTAYVQSTGGAIPPMTLIFQAAGGLPLTIGDYSTTTGSFAQIGQIGCFVPEVVDFTVLEIERLPNGVLSRFAADFSTTCPNWQPPLPEAAHGSVRFQSTIGFAAFSMTPLRAQVTASDATLPDQAVGTSATTAAFTVTNTGSLPLHPIATDSITDDLSIGDGSCDGSAVAAGASCTIAIRFSPTSPGPQISDVTLHIPELARADRALLVAGLGTTATHVSVSIDPTYHAESLSDQGFTSYQVTLDPPDAVGTVSLHTTCGVARYLSGGGTAFASTPPGPCDAWATFSGNTGSGYQDSSSGVVTFTQPVRATTFAAITAGNWVTGNTVTIHVSAESGNGAVPSDGQLSLRDADTNALLASMTVTPDDRAMDVSVVTWTPGMRRLRAIYEGSASMVGSTSVLSYRVEEDASPPTLSIYPSDHTGWTQATSLELILNGYDASNDLIDMRLSNDGIHWFEDDFAASVPWSIVDPTYGGSPDDGPRTIRAQVRDRVGIWSDIATWGITLDRAAPVGSVVIAGGVVATNQSSVSIDVSSSDTTSPVTHVALSNDGVTWTTRTYSAKQVWSLDGAAATGNLTPAPADGPRTVFVKWKDEAGNWSSVKMDTIVLDTVAPTVTAPRRGFVAGTTVTTGSRIDVRVPWSGTDAGSGIARYELARSTDGGAWTSIAATLLSPSSTFSLLTGHTYAFRVRGFDKAGNVSAWATGQTFRVRRYQETSSRISYLGAWMTATSTSFLGGTARKSSRTAAKASLTFSGRSVAWIARKGPDRGRAEVFVNGTKVATVDLYAARYQNRKVVWVGLWTTTASRKVTIKVLATNGRHRVDLDALFTAN